MTAFVMQVQEPAKENGMAVYAISDVHLSLGVSNKAMDVFGPGWANHMERLQEGWQKTVAPEDIVLIAGDISWATYMPDAMGDLLFLHNLPGQKVILRGNHDYWWSAYGKVRTNLPPSILAVQNNVVQVGDIHVCGTRGWTSPNMGNFSEEKDRKLFEREKIRLRLSLKGLKEGEMNLCMLHYPPFTERGDPTEFAEIIAEYSVKKVVYGHLHGKSGYGAFQGMWGNTEYVFSSADCLGFVPKKILD